MIAGNVANQVLSTQEFLDEVVEVEGAYSELMYRYYRTEFPFWDETAAVLMVDDSTMLNSTACKPLSLNFERLERKLTGDSLHRRRYLIRLSQLRQHPHVLEGTHADSTNTPERNLCYGSGWRKVEGEDQEECPVPTDVRDHGNGVVIKMMGY